jgi:hypothetical protein
VRGKVPLIDRVQYQPQRRLHDPIPHRRNPQRSRFSAPRLGNPHPPERLGMILPFPQLVRQALEVLRQVALAVCRRLVIPTRCPVVGLHLLKARPPRAQGVDLVH